MVEMGPRLLVGGAHDKNADVDIGKNARHDGAVDIFRAVLSAYHSRSVKPWARGLLGGLMRGFHRLPSLG